MAMVNVVYWLPTGGVVVQVTWLCFCIHGVNRMNSHNALASKHDHSNVKIVVIVICIITIIIAFCSERQMSLMYCYTHTQVTERTTSSSA